MFNKLRIIQILDKVERKKEDTLWAIFKATHKQTAGWIVWVHSTSKLAEPIRYNLK